MLYEVITIAFFENKGLAKIKEDDQAMVWYEDFLEFIKQEKVFSELLTPAAYGLDQTRWDMYRISEFNVITSYSIHYTKLYEIELRRWDEAGEQIVVTASVLSRLSELIQAAAGVTSSAGIAPAHAPSSSTVTVKLLVLELPRLSVTVTPKVSSISSSHAITVASSAPVVGSFS